ncbi:transcription factor NIGT1-like [Zingiber officinale]|uniref:transcription factor NIGT1-like n=1 Tax=Zingiber officinale TaxID=94328 RepID=UPI001C4D238E|nr:transcription factor NIGT1-like [Zingiber officinale]
MCMESSGGLSCWFRELIRALEEERQKVEVFQRELPLSLHLLNQTIESYKKLMASADLNNKNNNVINLLGKPVAVGDQDLDEKDEEGSAAGEDRNGHKPHRKRKMKRYWSEELHERFLHALEKLGGCHVATPKKIRKLMKVEELTSDEIKSHLQKFRNHERGRRMRSPVVRQSSSSSSPQPATTIVAAAAKITGNLAPFLTLSSSLLLQDQNSNLPNRLGQQKSFHECLF